MNASKSYRIGDATVIKISEMLLTGFTPRALLPHIEAEVLTNCPEWATSGSVDPVNGNVILSVHTWLVKKVESHDPYRAARQFQELRLSSDRAS